MTERTTEELAGALERECSGQTRDYKTQVVPTELVHDAITRLRALEREKAELQATIEGERAAAESRRLDRIAAEAAFDIESARIDKIASYVGASDYVDSIGPILTAIDRKLSTARAEGMREAAAWAREQADRCRREVHHALDSGAEAGDYLVLTMGAKKRAYDNAANQMGAAAEKAEKEGAER